MLRMLVWPAPDGPNSAVSPGPAVKRAARIRSPRRRETSISIATALPFAMRAADEPFGKNQRAEREHNRQQREPPQHRFAARPRQRRVNCERQPARFARDGRDKGECCAVTYHRDGKN